MLIMNEGQDGDDVDEIDWLILATNNKEQEDGELKKKPGSGICQTAEALGTRSPPHP